MGDSIIAGVGVAAIEDAIVGQVAAALASDLKRRVVWSADGRSGIRARGILEQLVPHLPQGHADIVLVSAGVNDVTGLRRSRQWRLDLECLLRALETRYTGATIVMAGIPPLYRFPALPWPLRSVLGQRARRFDEIAEAVAHRRPRCLHVPTVIAREDRRFAPDGYHPSAESYETWGRALAGTISEHLRAGSRQGP